MSLYCRLDEGGFFELEEGREGAPIAAGVFSQSYPKEERGPLLKQLIQAPGALAILQAVLLDLELVLAEAVRVAGGGVTGLAAAEAAFAPLFQHKEAIEKCLSAAGL